jgi:plasmid maintenance system killer protein
MACPPVRHAETNVDAENAFRSPEPTRSEKGQYSIRINGQWRIFFMWIQVEIVRSEAESDQAKGGVNL